MTSADSKSTDPSTSDSSASNAGTNLPRIIPHGPRGGDDSQPLDQIVVDPRRVAIPRTSIYLFAAVLVLSIVGSLLIGVAIGRKSPRGHSSRQEVSGPVIVSGRITYLDPSGQTLPDGGAAIVVIQEEERPPLEDKLQATGLRPQDPAPDSQSREIAKLTQLGGSYARSDDTGEFELRIPHPGRYFVLIISRNGSRAPDVAPSRTEFSQMSRLIADPDELLSDRRFRWLNESIVRNRRIVLKLE